MTMRAFWNRHGKGCNEHFFLHLLRQTPTYLPSLSRIAVQDGRVIGGIYCFEASLLTSHGRIPLASFGPLAVDPLSQGLGVGKALFETVVPLFQKKGYPAIAILGEPDYYPKLGFYHASQIGLSDANGDVYDPLMAYPLQGQSPFRLEGRLLEDNPAIAASEDQRALEAFNRSFPAYPQVKVAAQWLHEAELGRISSASGATYLIRFWESEIPAKLASSYSGGPLHVGDWVSFLRFQGRSSDILTKEIPE